MDVPVPSGSVGISPQARRPVPLRNPIGDGSLPDVSIPAAPAVPVSPKTSGATPLRKTPSRLPVSTTGRRPTRIRMKPRHLQDYISS